MHFDVNDRKRLSDYYLPALKKFGSDSHLAVHWTDGVNQQKRFEVLSRVDNLSNASILDVGCGVGDLYPLLEKKFSNFSYLGIDLLPEMAAAAKLKYPQANFEGADIFNINQKFDYLLASGSMTFKVAQGKPFYFEMINHLFNLANKAVAFNMLDSDFYFSDSLYLAYDKREAQEFCQSLTPNLSLVSGYLDGDFTIYLYK